MHKLLLAKSTRYIPDITDLIIDRNIWISTGRTKVPQYPMMFKCNCSDM